MAGWEQWLAAASGYFLVWRLCLYGATACGWMWMRRRLLAREGDDAQVLWGVGIDPSITSASKKAILSALNRAQRG